MHLIYVLSVLPKFVSYNFNTTPKTGNFLQTWIQIYPILKGYKKWKRMNKQTTATTTATTTQQQQQQQQHKHTKTLAEKKRDSFAFAFYRFLSAVM